MGTDNAIKTGMASVLFSKTQRRVLGLLFGNPDRSYYTKEIVRFAGVGIGSVQRELKKLSSAELLTTKEVGNQKHYQANRHSPIFNELRGIVLKTFGVADTLRKALAPLADCIEVAFIFGSVSKGTDTATSDIDVMVISDDLSYPEIFSLLSGAETELGRSINPTVYKQSELKRKRDSENAFISRILQQPKIFLIGSEDDI